LFRLFYRSVGVFSLPDQLKRQWVAVSCPRSLSGPTAVKKMKNREDRLTASVLVVDHEREMFDILQSVAQASDNGINPAHAATLQEGIDKNRSTSFDIILMKDRLPDGFASYVIPRLLDVPCPPELIVYTNRGDPDEAERILKNGCWDYVIRPPSAEKLLRLLERAVLYRREKLEQGRQRRTSFANELQSEGIVGSSQALQQCLNQVAKAAQSEANVLISGESGTGKELFATALHKISRRANKKFVVVDCAALPTTLVESILFGHEKGSFTGADKSMPGLIKQADGGTLFLDEVGELPMDIQKKFLRVLQERVFRPVGSHYETKSDFRLIAATNKNLQELCTANTFREDLLFRLRTFQIELPPLRARTRDITELAYFYKEKYGRLYKQKEKRFSTDFLVVLKQYDWPGNVRELFHALERAFAAAQDSETLFPMHLPTDIRIRVTRQVLEARSSGGVDDRYAEADFAGQPIPLQVVRDQAVSTAEQEYLRRLIIYTTGDLQKSLAISGLSRSRFYALLKKYQITLQERG
jgi:two-component system NtrC family response regulator